MVHFDNAWHMHITEINVKGIVHITWCCATPRLSGKNTGLSFEKSQVQICIPQQLCLWVGTLSSLLHSLVEEDSSQWSPGCLITSSLEPIHICSWYTYPGKCSRNKFSVHKHSDSEHCEMFSVPLHSDFKSAHVSVCAVWLLGIYCATCWRITQGWWGHFYARSSCW